MRRLGLPFGQQSGNRQEQQRHHQKGEAPGEQPEYEHPYPARQSYLESSEAGRAVEAEEVQRAADGPTGSGNDDPGENRARVRIVENVHGEDPPAEEREEQPDEPCENTDWSTVHSPIVRPSQNLSWSYSVGVSGSPRRKRAMTSSALSPSNTT